MKNKDSLMPMLCFVYFNGLGLVGWHKNGRFWRGRERRNGGQGGMGEEKRTESKCDEMKKVEMVAVPLLERSR